MRATSHILMALVVGCGSAPDPAPDARVTGMDATAPVDAGTDAFAPEDGPRFELVGHSPLDRRGMNAGLALHGGYAYVGARNDLPGVMIVDVSSPARPTVRGSLPSTDGASARELRVLPEANLLAILEMPCHPTYHGCRLPPEPGGALALYDLDDPAQPVLRARERMVPAPHEMFLWQDPDDRARFLLYVATPPGPPSLRIYEVRADDRLLRPLAALDLPVGDRADQSIHSIAISPDGRTGYVSHTGAGFVVVDTSDLAIGAEDPDVRVIGQSVDLPPPTPPVAHSMVPIPGRALAVTTDEVYPAPLGTGCPWGWVRVLDLSDPSRPHQIGELRLAENAIGRCTDALFTAHNPTTTAHLALVTWYAGGLRAIDLDDPRAPREVARFVPTPLSSVSVEDPFLTGSRVFAWSYPIVQDGLVYFVDARNGLYVLRYRGPWQDEIEAAAFLDGSSNLR